MSSSSAYSNVLLTTPAASAVNTAARKNLVEDDTSNDFQQTFQEVRAETDDRPKEPQLKKSPAANKPTPVENEPAAAAEQSGAPATPASKAPAPKKEPQDQDKPESTDANKSPESTDSANANPVAAAVTTVQQNAQPPQAGPATALPLGLAAGEVGDAAHTEAGELLTQTLGDGKDGGLKNTPDAATAATPGQLQDGVLALAGKSAIEGDSMPLSAKVKLAKAMAAITPASSPLQADAQNAAQLAAAQASAGLAGINAPAAADASVLATGANAPTGLQLASEKTSDAKAADAVTAEDIIAAATADDSAAKSSLSVKDKLQGADQPASASMGEPKAVFEKMLQTMAASSAGQPVDTGAQASSSTSTSSTLNSSFGAMDSLLRADSQAAPAARNFVVQTAVPVAVGQPQWSQAVGEKVLWLAAQNVSSAEIHLHPLDMGPMQVKVSVNQDQTNVTFTSHHPVVRELLDQNLGRLRDMFTEQGLNLGSVDVSDKSFQRQQGEGRDQQGQARGNDALIEDEAPTAVSAIVQQRLVDHYA